MGVITMKKIFPVLQYANIPNLFTTLGLCFGIAACYYLSDSNLKGVLICLFFASLMDLVDGFFAVKLNRQTPFGIYADTLVDFFICCIMPVLMAYTFMGNGVLLMCSVGFYCICGLWRLANYNVMATENQAYFTGLPVPSGMLLTSMTIWGAVQFDIPIWLCAIVFVINGLFMVSSIKLKKYGIWQKTLWVVCLMFLAAILFFN
jgi:CDP-diacylglycerol--serine O-phosphatidyltransferase